MSPLAKSWLFGVFLVVAGEVVITKALPEGLQTRNARERMRQQLEHPRANIMILGASGAAAAINPDQLALSMPVELAGWTVANYALAGSSTLYLAPQLERLIAAGRQPDMIIFAPHPANLGSADPDRFAGRFATVGELVGFVRMAPPAQALFHGLMARTSYSFRYRDELRLLLTQGDRRHLRNMRRPVSPQRPPVRPTEAEVLAVDAPGRGAAPFEIGPALSRPFQVDPLAGAGVRRFLELARSHNIQVVWVHLPTCESLADLPHHKESAEEYLTFARGFEQKGLALMGGETVPVMPDSWFTDPWHVGASGRAAFSRTLSNSALIWPAFTD